MSVRIRDIAELAKVSPATVSLVLNNKPGVGQDTRGEIKRIARELNYVHQEKPEPAPDRKSSLCLLHIARHGHTLNRDHDVFIADYIEGLSRSAKHHGMGLEILTFKTTPLAEIREAAQKSDASAYIVLGTELSIADIAEFHNLGKPLVFIDTFDYFQPFDFVDMNNEESVHTIVCYFATRGHREIGFVKSTLETRNFKLREEGFKQSLSLNGLLYREKYTFAVDSTYHGAYEDMKAHIEAGMTPPSALFCANDIIACGCMKAFQEKGIRVPDDVSIIGFDDLPLSAVVDPPLTTVRVSKAQIGRMAIQILNSRLHHESERTSMKVLIAGKLVERESVKTIENDR